MSDTSLLFNFLRGRDTASPHMRTVANNANAMGAAIRLSSVVSVAATTAMIAGFASLGAQGVALVAALAPLVGLLAYLPALGFAALAAIAPLVMAFAGLGAALKHTASAGGASSQSIVAAERRIEQAQRASAQAQVDLNAARDIAARKISDMTRELARAHLDERGAVLAVADAQRTLREARMSGDRSAVQHAQLGYAEAAQSLIEVRVRLADVTEEEKKRRTAGVEASDEVQKALQHQKDTQQQLSDAVAAQKSSGDGGGVDKAAQAYAKLSTAGKQLVDVLKALRPAWRGVQQAVQQSVFSGVAGDVKALSAAYLPVMKTQLVAIGQGWNNAFRGTAQLATSAGFVKDMNTSLANTATFWQRVGASFAPFLSGFRQFMVVGSMFLPSFGQWILDIGNRFNAWATAARNSGRAHDWIQNALTVLGQVWQVLKNLGSSIVSIFKAGSGGPDWLPGLVAGTATLSAWLASPVGQGKLAEVFGTLRDVGSRMWGILTDIAPTLLNLFTAGGTVSDTMSVFGVVVGFAADHLQTFADWLPVIIAAFIAWRVAQAAAVAVDIVRIPLLIAQTVSNFALASAMRANMVATGAATVAQRGLNLAMIMNPIGLIIAAIVLLVAAFIYLWTHSEGFRKFWIGLWNHIWSFLKVVGAWFAGPFVNFFVGAWTWIKKAFATAVNWIVDRIVKIILTVKGIKDKIAAVASGMWDGIKNAFKSVLNWIFQKWNSIRLTLPTIDMGPLGKWGGYTLQVPQIPMLAKGGLVTSGGAAIVGERGPEMVYLPRGASVSPNGGGGGEIVLRLEGTTGNRMLDDWYKWMFRNMVQQNGGSVVKVAG